MQPPLIKINKTVRTREPVIQTVQDLMFDWMKTEEECFASNIPAESNDESIITESDTTGRCGGLRVVRRRIMEKSPILILRMYELNMSGRLTLDRIMQSDRILLDGETYILAGITMHQSAHFCAVVRVKGRWYWYDGLRGRLGDLKQNRDQWYTMHALYCQID